MRFFPHISGEPSLAETALLHTKNRPLSGFLYENFIDFGLPTLAFRYPLGSVGELESALLASSLENLTAVSRAHSLSEAVFLASLSFLRLVCSEHYPHLPFIALIR